MMRILSINQPLHHDTLSITNLQESELPSQPHMEEFDYIIINGGDGTIRRVVKTLHTIPHHAKFILNPTGSFNVVAKIHRVPKLNPLLEELAQGHAPQTKAHPYYQLNNEVFLFSAGNMGDLQHIFLAETLRFGILKKGITKYILAVLFLLPVHLVMTPFMLMSKKSFSSSPLPLSPQSLVRFMDR